MQQKYCIDHIIALNWGLLTPYSAIRGRTVNRERALLFLRREWAEGWGSAPLSTQSCPGVTQPPRNWVFPSPMAPSPNFSRISTPWGYKPVQKPHQPPPAPPPSKAGPYLSHDYPTLLDLLPGPASERFHTSPQAGSALAGSTFLSGAHLPSQGTIPLLPDTGS